PADLRLSPDAAVLVMQALNPQGVAWLRWNDENNVDLKHNSRDDLDGEAGEGYAELEPLLKPRDLEPDGEQARWQALGAWIAHHGERDFQQVEIGRAHV